MGTLLLLAVPALLLAAWAVWRMLRRRAVARHTLLVLSSILLLLYFATTAGLGVFWVANQDLPVFDLHYLFGYLTLALVVCHLVLNWRQLVTFFRHRSPRVLVQPDGRSWRPSVRGTMVVVGLIVYGAIAFLLGLRQGAERITITRVQVEEGGEERAGDARSPIARNVVKTDEGEVSLSAFYQERSAHTRKSVMTRSSGLDLAREPEVFKHHPGRPAVALPDGLVESTVDVASAIEARRPTGNALGPKKMTREALSHVLRAANGITARRSSPRRTYFLRAAPSAGALYPTEVYVLVRDVEGLAAGLYHHGIERHELRLLKEGDLSRDLASAVSRGNLVESASVTVVLSAVFFRTVWKYGERSYRYVNMDTGHVTGNLTLAASALGYATRLVGRFDDDRVNALLDVDGVDEAALLVIPVGGAVDSSRSATWTEPAFRSAGDIGSHSRMDVVPLVHEGTKLVLAVGERVSPPETRAPDPPAPGDPVRLPSSTVTSVRRGLFDSIQSRRSRRRFSRAGIDLDRLSTILLLGMGRTAEGPAFPPVQETDALGFYVVANRVVGLDPGVYAYDRERHALLPIRKGDQRRRTYEAALFQDAAGDADVVVVQTVDMGALGFPDGDRGYRYAFLEAGLVGENLYLLGEALGLGVCGIGAFFDEEVVELLDLDAREEAPAYMVALGSIDE